MNFTAIKWCGAIGLAAGAAAIVGGGSASAQALTGQLVFRATGIVTGVTSTTVTLSSSVNTSGLEFTSAASSGSDSSYSGYVGGRIFISNLNTAVSNSFIVRLQAPATNPSLGELTFTSTGFSSTNLAGGDRFTSDISGVFNRPTPQITNLSNQLTTTRSISARSGSGAGNNELVLNLTPVPTPALVPAAVGFGLAMLRKRKQEESEEAAIEKV